MRILYDGWMFTTQAAGGVNRLFQRLIDGLPGDFEVALTTGEIRRENFPSRPGLRVLHWQRYGFRPGRLSYLLEPHWFRLAERRFAPDLLHPTHYRLLTRRPPAASSAPSVVTVHDMIHERFAAEMDPEGHLACAKREAVEAAAAVICVSENTKRDLLERITVPEDRVHVVHLAGGLDPALAAGAGPPPPRPFLLHVGSRARGYKNFDRLLRAHAALAGGRDAPDLVVVGKPFDADESARIDVLGSGNRIRNLGPVDDATLAMLYARCLAFVYPSLYEGFGIPPLEAMECGAPVVASRAGSLPEVLGDAAEWFEPLSDESLVEALRRCRDDGARREDLLARGRARAARYRWDLTVARTVEVYRSVVGGREG